MRNLLLQQTLSLIFFFLSQTLNRNTSYSWSKLKHELLKNIRELEIYDDDDSRFLRNQSRVLLNLSSFSKLSSLRILKLEVSSFDFSSLQIELIFLSLESLTLVGTNLKEDPMPALQKLPRLEDLVLKDCEWFGGAKMSISSQGFRRLRKLELITKRLDELHIEDEAMPSLLKLNPETQHGAKKLVVPDRLQVYVRTRWF
ncbi:putative disease resistance RPP13-like protein 2 [Raphanus sativus]|nr:putative disease resistance RPP13-like protein 2 [Raphanus sativus]